MAVDRISKDIFLDIAEHCDLKTLSALMQTSNELSSLIAQHEHSISKAKIATLDMSPPLRCRILSSYNRERCVISERNSFATVQELELRRKRMASILNNSGFLFTDAPKVLSMDTNSLEKLKAGLKHAMYTADRIADLEADPGLINKHSVNTKTNDVVTTGSQQLQTDEEKVEPQHQGDADWGNSPFDAADNDPEHGFIDPQFEHQIYAQVAVRELQYELLCSLSTRDLAWLLTLADGASKGYSRYNAKQLQAGDPGMMLNKVMAFKEVLLRQGSFFLWGFVRGNGDMSSFVRTCISQCAEEIMFYESGVLGDMPKGLHMTIMKELTQRMVQVEMAKEPEERVKVDPEEFGPLEVWGEINKIVGEEIGCKGWEGYQNIDYPTWE